MNRLKFTSLAIAVVLLSLTSLPAEQNKNDTTMRPAASYITGLTQRFPVSLALPTSFIVMPLHDDVPDIDGGLLWGEGNVLKKFKKDPALNAGRLTGPVFVVTISNGVMQTGREKFNVEDVLEAQFKTAGVRDVVVTKSKWGEFPVLHFRGVRPDGRVVLGAWVGANAPDGFTMFFDFRSRSSSGQIPTEDEQIWKSFINDTK